MKNVVIVGGGFAGLKAALELSRKKLPDLKITLISSTSHFEYHARLYHVLAGHSPLEVCVPLREIFHGTDVEVVEDTIIEADLKKHIVKGMTESVYTYDMLVLAVGSENAYYDTPGLKELSFSINSMSSTIRLNRHLHDIFASCKASDNDEKNCDAHIIIVGGGATGCEVAAELAIYARQIAKKHGIDPSYVTIDLIHSGSRLMSMLPENTSEQIKQRLYSLGVNIFLNRRVMKEEIEEVYLKDMKMKTKTLIWCAGVQPNNLIRTLQGIELDKKGRLLVNEYLQVQGYKDVYAAGDIAATAYAGMAQTALYDGDYIANVITAQEQKVSPAMYSPPTPSYAIPLGHSWALSSIGSFKLSGYLGWLIRRWYDFNAYRAFLPFRKAITAFRSETILCEYCSLCCGLVAT